jgi:ATP-dependent DNA helicase RecG
LTFDEAGLQCTLVQCRYGELAESGPSAPRGSGGLVAALLRRLSFKLSARQRDVFDVLSAEISATRAASPT